MERTLFSVWPRLAANLSPVELGDFPTPVERMLGVEQAIGQVPMYVKRDDRSSSIYGGNKVRTLEVLFGRARALGAEEVVAVGAYGSNHAVATVLHAPRAGLRSGAVLFPQPPSAAALENLRVTAARSGWFRAVPHWSLLPWHMWRVRAPKRFVMVPGGATPEGALGYVAAAFELAGQVDRGELPSPSHIVVGVGSTCTSAGLLVGLTLATRAGFFGGRRPQLVSVRVTPWPVTGRFRILSLAERTSRHLAQLCQEPSIALNARELNDHFRVDGSQLGRGYGHPSALGLETLALFQARHELLLDTTYSAKAAAGFLALARGKLPGPLLFWSTKTTLPLPTLSPEELDRLPAAVRRWIAQAERLTAS